MITALTGIALWLLTELAKYLSKITGRTISIKIVIIVLSLIAGTVYYAINQFDPVLWKQVAEFTAGAFGASQLLWMGMDKILPKDTPTV